MNDKDQEVENLFTGYIEWIEETLNGAVWKSDPLRE
jgi:hypothetical protein